MDKDKKNSATGKGKIKTPEVRFNLKSITDKNKTTLISAVFRYDNKRLVYSTQHKIAPKHWSLRTQSPLTSYLLYNDVNGSLEEIKNAILKIHSETKDNPLSVEEFKSRLDIVLMRVEKEPEPQQIDFTDYLQSHIESIKSGNELKRRTAQKYNTLLINLQKFRPGKIPFESIDIKFRNDFIKWRYSSTKAVSQNTINKDLECIKNVLKQSFKAKLHSNDIYKDEDFGVQRVPTSSFALTENEIDILINYDFSDNERLERVRDWFLIACWSALRWSDFSQIQPEQIIKINGDPYINLDTEKTNTEVHIPVDDRLYSLLEKYNFKSIEISNQKFNDYIKEVFKIAGITDKVILTVNVKGVPTKVKYRKCEIVSAHDARRTWATINFLKGYPKGLLMQVTGHKREETFNSYVGATSKQLAIELSKLMKANKTKSND
jgi:integrase